MSDCILRVRDGNRQDGWLVRIIRHRGVIPGVHSTQKLAAFVIEWTMCANTIDAYSGSDTRLIVLQVVFTAGSTAVKNKSSCE